MTTRRASWDDALRRFGCSMTTWSSSAMTGATIALSRERLAPLAVRRTVLGALLAAPAGAVARGSSSDSLRDRRRRSAAGVGAVGSAGAVVASAGSAASTGIGASSVPVSSACASTAAAYCGGLGAGVLAGARPGAAAPGGARSGRSRRRAASQPVQDQLERAQPAASAPVAALQEERVQLADVDAGAVERRRSAGSAARPRLTRRDR